MLQLVACHWGGAAWLGVWAHAHQPGPFPEGSRASFSPRVLLRVMACARLSVRIGISSR